MDEYNQPEKKWSPGYIYIIDYGDSETFKIGYTKYHPDQRIKQISKGTVIMPMHLVLHAQTYLNAYYIEQLLHMMLDDKHVRGEWFKLDFVDICRVLDALIALESYIEYSDRWFDVIVPGDYQKYIDGGAVSSNNGIRYVNELLMAGFLNN
jgi:hypothetical protein